jgi:SH3-like domain-containing protein
MHRIAVATLSVLLAGAGWPILTAADGAGAAGPDAGAASDAPAASAAPATIQTTLAKKANIRFGPSLSAKVVTTLDAGTPVEVIGPAMGMPDWYAIRFPRAGTAWVHEKVLEPLDGGKRFRVIEDRAKARDDATLGGTIVCELAKGEILESKDRVVGQWHAVYPANAIAYVYKSMLVLTPVVQTKVDDAVKQDDHIELLWQDAQRTYAAYKQALDSDYNLAATLDWTHLSDELDQVATQHPSVRTRLAAQRLENGIQRVVAAVEQVQRNAGITPVRDVPGQPVSHPAEDTTPPAPADTAANPGTTPAAPAPETPAVQPASPSPSGAASSGSEAVRSAASTAPPAPTPGETGYVATGWLEEKAFPDLGVSHVIIDKDGKVCAFIKVKPGSGLQPSEYFWRLVGIKGDVEPIPPSRSKLPGTVPLVTVSDIALLSH